MSSCSPTPNSPDTTYDLSPAGDYCADLFQPDALRKLRSSLLHWYRRHHRDLPWRNTRDPYAIWVSEIMLQQTQVATVREYYARFLARFPTVVDLAQASEAEVLTLWSGLGYYRRARQLHQAARNVQAHWGGVFPDRFEDVLELPGIGRYTAGAICSFAFHQRHPVLEANTNRLFSRLLRLRMVPQVPQAQRLLWSFAESVLPERVANRSTYSQLNQAVMELGSLVCTPTRPNCEACPLRAQCPTYADGLVESIPVPKPKPKFTPLTHATALIGHQQCWLMRCYGTDEWWTGMWDFPRVNVGFHLAEKPTGTQLRRVETAFQEQHDLDLELERYLRKLRHGVTRYRITLHCWEARIRNSASTSSKPTGDDRWRWLTRAEALQHPLTSTAKKLLAQL